jgi:hypothetical protein
VPQPPARPTRRRRQQPVQLPDPASHVAGLVATSATCDLTPEVSVQVAAGWRSSTDGYFFQENVKAFDLLEGSQTNWVYNSQLDPGVYYVYVAGLDEPCFFAGLCPVREFTQVATLVIELPPPPPPRPRYEASVRTIHPRAIKLSGNWTYLGDTLRVRFRNASARPGDGRLYQVCYTHGRRLACRNGRIFGRLWDAWRLQVTPAAFAATSNSPGESTDGWLLALASGSTATAEFERLTCVECGREQAAGGPAGRRT